jgi:hypothetical protein
MTVPEFRELIYFKKTLENDDVPKSMIVTSPSDSGDDGGPS